MKSADEIRVICPECRKEYFVPTGMLEVWGVIEVKCNDCYSILRLDTLKEQMRKEIIEIMERSSYIQ